VLERNFLSLAQMMPGAAPNYTSKFSRVKFGGPADQRNGYTTIVDGGDLDDAIWGDPTVNVSQDAVQEFKVFRHQFDAQFGHALNAVVMVATRSGTNQLHGSGFYFGRDDALNAATRSSARSPSTGSSASAARGGPSSRTARTSSAPTSTHVDKREDHRAAGEQSLRPRENGAFPATSREPDREQDRPPPERHAARSSRVCLRRPVATRTCNPSSDTANVNDSSKMHSLIGEQLGALNTMVNTFGPLHVEQVATVPVTLGVAQVRAAVGDDRPELTSPQFFRAPASRSSRRFTAPAATT
jgi:hypothetical protein